MACLLMLMSAKSHADDAYAVTNVYDGDTVELSHGNSRFKLRLTNIDAPERNQAYGKKSRRALTKLCKGSHIAVTAEISGTDKYQRNLGKLYCNHTDASLYLVERGLAWHNAKYSNDPTTQQAEIVARQNKVGLWKSRKPMPPWIWRQRHPH